MKIRIEEALADCLDALKNGERTPEECLSCYPQYRNELAELLTLAVPLKEAGDLQPRAEFVNQAGQRLLDKLPDQPVTFRRPSRRIGQKRASILRRRFGMTQIILAAALALMTATGGVAYAADSAEPGDFLYDVDLAVEQLRLNLTVNTQAEVQLRLQLATERLEEAQNRFAQGDPENGMEALSRYGDEISTIAQTVGEAGGADREALLALWETAHAVHLEVLTGLLDKVPENALPAIERALEKSNLLPEGAPAGPPDKAPAGPSDDGGPGKSDDSPAGEPQGGSGGSSQGSDDGNADGGSGGSSSGSSGGNPDGGTHDPPNGGGSQGQGKEK